MNQFNLPLVMKVRRNHGLEHATIHVLGERTGFRSVAGYTIPAGFFLIGNFTAGEITLAVEDALRRLRDGERHLAVHSGCGTNYVTSGFLAGTLALASAWFGADRRRSRVDQISNAAFAATIGIVFGQALGRWLQANVTTSSDMGGMSIQRVARVMDTPARVHFVDTACNLPARLSHPPSAAASAWHPYPPHPTSPPV